LFGLKGVGKWKVRVGGMKVWRKLRLFGLEYVRVDV